MGAMSIQVIGLNPAVDVEWRVERYHWNEKTIIQSSRSWAGGKPPNVARWLRFLGAPSELLMPLGGAAGRQLLRDLRQWGVKVRRIPIVEETRTNVMVTPDVGRQLRFNPKGPRLSREEWAAVFEQAQRGFLRHSLVILSGSLPRGANPNVHARLVRAARRAGRRAILDCDGKALELGARAKPFLVKPNRFELAQWSGKALRSRRQFKEAALELATVTGGWVFLSLDAGGGMLVNAAEGVSLSAAAPRVKALNEVGAGDALLAQLAWQVERGTDPEEWLRRALAMGTAFVQAPAGRTIRRGEIERLTRQIRVRKF